MEFFGVGIGEAMLVMLITLIVVGPERFPQIAREGGRWVRMARRFTAEVTADVRSALDELENEVREQGGDLRSVREIGEDLQAGMRETAADLSALGRDTTGAATVDLNAATPEARRETAPDPAPAPDTAGAPEPPPRQATLEELQAQVVNAYREYHAPRPAPEPAAGPAATPASVSAPAVEAQPPAAPSPGRPLAVNPFPTSEPPPPPRSGKAEPSEADPSEAEARPAGSPAPDAAS